MKYLVPAKWRRFVFLSALLIALSILAVNCSDIINDPVVEDTTSRQDIVLTKDHPQIRAAINIQEKHTADLMKIQDVIGTAVGLTEDGRPCILVLTKTDIKTNALMKGMKNPLPETLDNTPVQIMVTGEIKAFKSTTTTVNHKAKQSIPIKLGTSGGWRYDLANGYCCGGTLGSLIQVGDTKYILSNYHVFEADIIPGGNDRVAETDNEVIQPGLIDVSCNADNAQNVGTLVKISSLSGSNVDAAVAAVIPGQVDEKGFILEINTLSKLTATAYLKQPVKKSGRTTGLTRSSVSGLNATVSITYDNECAGGTAFTKTFTGQIVISNRASKFLAGGDSGSLMVEDVAINPKAVGLLFAGSSLSAIANPITEVLSIVGSKLGGTATMVGN
jgi:hypothetical protein